MTKAFLAGLIMGAISWGGIGSVQAAQKLIAHDQDDLFGVVSAREVTRISVSGDRITSMARGAVGFTAENNAATGDLFIRPAGERIDQPINLFLTTEQGKTYKLLLQPEDVPAEQIIIINRQALLDRRGMSARSSYQSAVAELVARIIRDDMVDCLRSEAPDLGLPATVDGLGLYRVATIYCGEFTAEDMMIIGGDSAQGLSEADIAGRAGGPVAAVWLEADRLEPFSILRALIVRAGVSGS